MKALADKLYKSPARSMTGLSALVAKCLPENHSIIYRDNESQKKFKKKRDLAVIVEPGCIDSQLRRQAEEGL